MGLPGTLTIARKEFVDHASDRRLTSRFNIFTVVSSHDASQMERHPPKRTWMLAFPYGLFLIGVAASLLLGDNALTIAAVRVIGILILPTTIGFGWKIVLDTEENKIDVLTKWCVYSTLFYPAVLLIGVDPAYLGIGGAILAALSLALVAVYLRGIHLRSIGDSLTVLLLLAYFSLFYLLFLDNLDHPGPFIGLASSTIAQYLGAAEAGSNTLLQTYLTDLCLTGVITSIAPHVFLLDLINKVREHVLAEEALNEPTDAERASMREVE